MMNACRTRTSAAPACMPVYQRERAHDLWREVHALAVAHHGEAAHDQDISLDIDVAAYCAMEDADGLRCYTARDGLALIGYCVFFVSRHLHSRGTVQALQDLWFVKKEHRGIVGVNLLRCAVQALRAEGVHVLYAHAPAGSLADRVLAGMRRYALVDHVYRMRLDR